MLPLLPFVLNSTKSGARNQETDSGRQHLEEPRGFGLREPSAAHSHHKVLRIAQRRRLPPIYAVAIRQHL
jgi:hypothetical protein